MPVTILKIAIPGQDVLDVELEPGTSISIEAPAEAEEAEEEEAAEDMDEEPAEEPEPEADEEPEAEDEEEEDEEPRSAPASGWSRVAGFDALPAHKREALHALGPMTRSGLVLSKSRALPSGFERQSADSFVFLLSEPVTGRDGFILAGPWDLDEYALNPVVLYQHNSPWETPSATPDDLLPVGRAVQVAEPEEGVLISEIVFDTDSPRGANLERLYRGGFLSAVSARWYPESIAPAHKLDKADRYYNADPDVFVMYGNRLIEQSAVVIPGLASAVLLEGPIDSERALRAAREHVADPAFRSDLEAVILAAPSHRVEPSAAEPDNHEPAPATGWWGIPDNSQE